MLAVRYWRFYLRHPELMLAKAATYIIMGIFMGAYPALPKFGSCRTRVAV